jgi:hypothetical protein
LIQSNPPIVSPDGTCWWDGAAWQPLPGRPAHETAPVTTASGADRHFKPERSGAYAAIVAGIGIGLSAFLPWITVTAPFVGTINKSGLDGGGDGIFALGMGIVIALLGLKLATASVSWHQSRSRAFTSALMLLVSVLAAAVAIIDGGDASSRLARATSESSGFARGSVGAGIVLLGVCAGIAVLGSFAQMVYRSSERTPVEVATSSDTWRDV